MSTDSKEKETVAPSNESKDELPSDNEIRSWRAGKLKEYIKKHNSGLIGKCEEEKILNNLRFMALDSKPTAWNKSRLIALPLPLRRILIEDKKKNFLNYFDSFDESKIDIFVNDLNDSNEEETKQRDAVIEELCEILEKIKDKEATKKEESKAASSVSTNSSNDTNSNDDTKQTANDEYILKNGDDEEDEDEKKQREMHRHDADNDNQESSVSTHASMPPLMTDEESDENDDDTDKESQSSLSDCNEETSGNLEGCSSNDDEEKKHNALKRSYLTKGNHKHHKHNKHNKSKSSSNWMQPGVWYSIHI